VAGTSPVPCDLCGSTECELLFEAQDRLHGFEGTFSYVRCGQCGLVFMNPRVSPDEAARFYPPDYGPHQVEPQRRERELSQHKGRLRKRPVLGPVCARLTPKSRLLDLGCGAGGFLNEVRAATGCRVYGLDISAGTAKRARDNYGLDIFAGSLAEAPYPDDYFDVITARSYLEHVSSPSAVVLRIARLLKQGGSCVIRTPNFASFNRALFNEKWYHLDCPRHLYIFTPRTITSLVEKCGLSVRRIHHHITSKGLLGSLQYQVYGDNYMPEHRNRIRHHWLLRRIALPWAGIAAFMRRSDQMTVLAG